MRRLDGSVARLPVEDVVLVACARERMAVLQNKTTYLWLLDGSLPSRKCEDEGVCEMFKASLLDTLGLGVTGIRALDSWNPDWEEQFCAACGRRAKRGFRVGRHEFWQQLPGMFNLADWGTLNADMDDVVSS